jgi:hypothetical protein
LELIILILPLLFVLAFIYYALFRFEDRAKNYLHFISECPGPGMIRDTNITRPIDFNIQIDEEKIIRGEKLQDKTIKELKEKIIIYRNRRIKFFKFSIPISVLLLILILFKGPILKFCFDNLITKGTAG